MNNIRLEDSEYSPLLEENQRIEWRAKKVNKILIKLGTKRVLGYKYAVMHKIPFN